MTISVIIPTRNRYSYIRDLLNDLEDQTKKADEVIVVDQSDDHEELTKCVHVKTDTTGPCVSRNLGVNRSFGDILVFLDDDARIAPDFLYQITYLVENRQFDAVSGAICDIEGNYPDMSNNFLEKPDLNFIKVITSNPTGAKSRTTLAIPGCCFAITRKVYQAVGGFDEYFDPTGAGEDREMAIKLYKHGYSVWYNAKAKLYHIGASSGGSRDVGSRTMMLDVNSYKICIKHFSPEIAGGFRKLILSKYFRAFISSLGSGKLVRSRWKYYSKVKQLLKEADGHYRTV